MLKKKELEQLIDSFKSFDEEVKKEEIVDKVNNDEVMATIIYPDTPKYKHNIDEKEIFYHPV